MLSVAHAKTVGRETVGFLAASQPGRLLAGSTKLRLAEGTAVVCLPERRPPYPGTATSLLGPCLWPFLHIVLVHSILRPNPE